MAAPAPLTSIRPPTTVSRSMGGSAGASAFQTPFAGFSGSAPTNGGNIANYFGDYTTRERQAALGSGEAANAAYGNQQQSRNQFMSLLNQDPSQVLGAYVQSALPEFNKALEGIRENAIQRGIGTGDLGTAYEGSLASAFQRNIAGQAAGLYGQRLNAMQGLYGQDLGSYLQNSNQYAQMLGGLYDQYQQRKAQHQNFLGGLVNSIGQIGAAVGTAIKGAGTISG